MDFSELAEVAIRSRHVYDFAQKRGEQLVGLQRVRSALFSEDLVGFAVAQLYEELMKETLLDARAFRHRPTAAVWLGVPAEILRLKDKPAPPP